MSRVVIQAGQLATTLGHLRRAGSRRSECAVLWIGRRGFDEIEVTEVYRPEQQAGRAHFRFSPRSMRQIFNRLREERLMVAAQVHTHPAEAFHSYVDDQDAIVRHVGALSFVLPDFARYTTQETFLQDMAVFRYDESGAWTQVPQTEVSTHFQILR